MELEDLQNNDKLNHYLEKCNEYLGEMGALDHSLRHSNIVAERSFYILKSLGYKNRICYLSCIAGYFHDIGNMITRYEHGRCGSIMLLPFLKEIKLSTEEISMILGAIGNHEERTGYIVNPIAASLIIADKSELHKSRVRKSDVSEFKLRDKVNFAVQDTYIEVDKQNKIINLFIDIDTKTSSVMEYFEIFLTKMLMCQKAANFLECEFQLYINQARLL